MGYNLSVGCHDCRVTCFALRGQEAQMIRRFSIWHSEKVGRVRPRHRLEARIDNGFSWEDEFPPEYADVYDEVMGE